MGGSSKELLMMDKDSSASAFQTSLLVCGRDSSASQSKGSSSVEKLVTSPIPQSQVLGKVRDFLGVFSEANRQLQQDAKDNSKKYDIESLTGNEAEVIETCTEISISDLMLGVAELRNQQALAAAEAALAGGQQLIKLDGSSSESVSDDDTNGEGSPSNDKRRSKKQPKIVEMP
ncbi:hypothetical protein LINPERPRIM_LOCUS18652 [Linum perenne]